MEARCPGSPFWENLLGDPTVCRATSGVVGRHCSGKKALSSHLNPPPLPLPTAQGDPESSERMDRDPNLQPAKKVDIPTGTHGPGPQTGAVDDRAHPMARADVTWSWRQSPRKGRED